MPELLQSTGNNRAAAAPCSPALLQSSGRSTAPPPPLARRCYSNQARVQPRRHCGFTMSRVQVCGVVPNRFSFVCRGDFRWLKLGFLHL
jgi:hypothetical protein